MIVVGDVGRDGATKVFLRQEEEVIQALSFQASHEPLDVRCRIRSAVGDGHAFDAQGLTQPLVQNAAVGSSRLAWPTPPELAEDPIVLPR